MSTLIIMSIVKVKHGNKYFGNRLMISKSAIYLINGAEIRDNLKFFLFMIICFSMI